MGINLPEKPFPCSIIFDDDICYLTNGIEFFLSIQIFMFEELLECEQWLIMFCWTSDDSIIPYLNGCIDIDELRFCEFLYFFDHTDSPRSVENDDSIRRVLYKKFYRPTEYVSSKRGSEESAHFGIVLPSFSYIEFLQKPSRNTRKGEYIPPCLFRYISWGGSLSTPDGSTDDIGLYHYFA